MKTIFEIKNEIQIEGENQMIYILEEGDKIEIIEKEKLQEMSTMYPDSSDQRLFIRIWAETPHAPSFHLFRGKSEKYFEYEAVYLISNLERKDFVSNKYNDVPKQDLKKVIEFLKKESKAEILIGAERFKGTNWELLIFHWNSNNFNKQISFVYPNLDNLN